MIVKLRAVRGALRSTDGSDAGQVVKVAKRRFLVGSGDDCHLCCPSDAISPHHCEILIRGERAAVHDLGSRTGTFVNQQRVDELRELAAGDKLKFGRLEFEVEFERSAPKRPILKTDNESDGGISDWLMEAAQIDREERLANPEGRRLEVEPSADDDLDQPGDEAPGDNEIRKKKAKKKPGKLPKQQIVAADSVEAAEEGLRKLFRI